MEDNKFRKGAILTYLGVVIGILVSDVYDKHKRRKILEKQLDIQTKKMVDTCENFNDLIDHSKDKLEDVSNKLKA